MTCSLPTLLSLCSVFWARLVHFVRVICERSANCCKVVILIVNLCPLSCETLPDSAGQHALLASKVCIYIGWYASLDCSWWLQGPGLFPRTIAGSHTTGLAVTSRAARVPPLGLTPTSGGLHSCAILRLTHGVVGLTHS